MFLILLALLKTANREHYGYPFFLCVWLQLREQVSAVERTKQWMFSPGNIPEGVTKHFLTSMFRGHKRGVSIELLHMVDARMAKSCVKFWRYSTHQIQWWLAALVVHELYLYLDICDQSYRGYTIDIYSFYIGGVLGSLWPCFSLQLIRFHFKLLFSLIYNLWMCWLLSYIILELRHYKVPFFHKILWWHESPLTTSETLQGLPLSFKS